MEQATASHGAIERALQKLDSVTVGLLLGLHVGCSQSTTISVVCLQPSWVYALLRSWRNEPRLPIRAGNGDV